MPTPEETQDWPEKKLITSTGDEIGEIERIYIDRDTEQPKFAVVKTGLLGRDSTVIPILEAELQGDDVQVPFDKKKIRDAPDTDHGDELTLDDETALYEHYGVTPPSEVQERLDDDAPAAASDDDDDEAAASDDESSDGDDANDADDDAEPAAAAAASDDGDDSPASGPAGSGDRPNPVRSARSDD